MTVRVGSRFGTYEILAALGAGGMGEVYRARDTRLNRDVALKVQPIEFALDAERLARFAREAQVLASLNHPNIAAIYGFEEADGIRALVLELVEGPTLADRIAQGPISIDEALPLLKQIAEALEAAHEQGIIHRDLKPANIKLRPDGTVKVLDFGLAKALEPAVSVGGDATTSPTLTSPALTRMGVLLGTAAYMSPEQAKGRPADKRSDVWAFGCVMYEMLTGRHAFDAEDLPDTLAAVLRGEPNWTALPASLSPAIVTLVRACLEKDRRRRIGDLSTARFIIEHLEHAPASVTSRPQSRARLVVAAVLAAAAVAAIAAYATRTIVTVSAPSKALARFTIPLPASDRFFAIGVQALALSADGSRLVYMSNDRLYLRRMDRLEATPIPGTEGVEQAAGRGPFFSPDGQWVGFWAGGQIKKVSLNGGAPFVLCEAENPWGVSWTADNTILYGQSEQGGATDRAGIWRISGDGGKTERLVKVEPDQIVQSPQLLPGGRAILFTLAPRADYDAAQIVVQSLDSGTRDVVVAHGADARYIPTGHLVYAAGGSQRRARYSATLLAVPFDLTTLTVTGGAVPIVEDVAAAAVTAQFSIASQGALAYFPGDVPGNIGGAAQRPRTLVWVDRRGREEPIRAAPRAYVYPRLSPDGTRVALEVRDQDNDIWIWNFAGERLFRLTLLPTFEQYGVWTPDGESVIYASGTIGGPNLPRRLFRQRSDGTGTAAQLTQPTAGQVPSSVTPDGTALIFRQQRFGRVGGSPDLDLFLLALTGDRRPRPLVQTPFNELNAEVSPDGRWLAYQSNESGLDEVYVRPFPDVDAGKWPVSTGGGSQPLWARNGRELFYVSKGAVISVPWTASPTFTAGKPSQMVAGGYVLALAPAPIAGRMYDVSRDGQRFLMLKESPGTSDAPAASARIILVQNWLDELQRRVPRK
ncbi:MAG TPA: protein kinase [Vicinamibacterales bacterium]|nr:protein kinase [Vicinamibacterales bacterium]